MLGGISSSFESEYNQRDMPTPEPPRPAPAKAAPAPAPAIPVVLPSAEIAKSSAVKKSQTSQATTAPNVEYKGVSAMVGEDLNVSGLSLSPQKPRVSQPSKTQPAAPPASQPATQPVPTLLPAAELLAARNGGKEATKAPLQPLTSWGGVSGQFQEDYNHEVQPSPEPPPRAPEPPPAEEPGFAFREPTSTAPPASRSRSSSKEYTQPPASRSRNASKDYTTAVLQPAAAYGGIAAVLDEYNVPPSPTPPRRSSRESDEAYPVDIEKKAEPAQPEPEIDEHAAKREAFLQRAKEEAARKSHTNNHYGFSPLSSIH